MKMVGALAILASNSLIIIPQFAEPFFTGGFSRINDGVLQNLGGQLGSLFLLILAVAALVPRKANELDDRFGRHLGKA